MAEEQIKEVKEEKNNKLASIASTVESTAGIIIACLLVVIALWGAYLLLTSPWTCGGIYR